MANATKQGAAGAFRKPKKLEGFIADIKQFQRIVLPTELVNFQKWIALQLYSLILQKTPVDKGMLRGSWTISIGGQDKTPANTKSGAEAFTTEYGGPELLPSEQATFDSALAGMSDLKIGQVIWLNNSMPYVFRIEFDGHSSVKAPEGMVQISIFELKAFIKTAYKGYVALKKS